MPENVKLNFGMMGGSWKISLDFDSSADVASVRSAVSDDMRIHPIRIRMLAGIESLEDGRTLSSYDIKDEDFITLVVAPFTNVEYKDFQELDESEARLLDWKETSSPGPIMCVWGCGKIVGVYRAKSVFRTFIKCACSTSIELSRSPAGFTDISHLGMRDAARIESMRTTIEEVNNRRKKERIASVARKDEKKKEVKKDVKKLEKKVQKKNLKKDVKKVQKKNLKKDAKNDAKKPQKKVASA